MSLTSSWHSATACSTSSASCLGGRSQDWGLYSTPEPKFFQVLLQRKSADAEDGKLQSRSRPTRRSSLSQDAPSVRNIVNAMSQEHACFKITPPERRIDTSQKGLQGVEGQSRRHCLSWLLGGALADWSGALQWPRPASAAGWGLPWSTPAVQTAPSRGNCATCIGVVDDTLASCGSLTNCISSFDDRPPFFCAPWEYPSSLPEAVRNLEQEIERLGGTVKEAQQKYVYATFVDEKGVIDDVEWLFSDSSSDRIVQIHAASRAREQPDGGRNAKRLNEIRAGLQWEQVPILRNRVRKLFFIESPWDTFGPEPPPGSYDYDNGFD